MAGRDYTVGEWTELSRPPYFTAFHGAYGRRVRIGYFPAMAKSQVKLVGGPSKYVGGAAWSLLRLADVQPGPQEFSVSLKMGEEGAMTFRSERFEHQTRRDGELRTP